MITKGNGDFDFDQLPVMGSLQLKISASGFAPYNLPISFMPKPGEAVSARPSQQCARIPGGHAFI